MHSSAQEKNNHYELLLVPGTALLYHTNDSKACISTRFKSMLNFGLLLLPSQDDFVPDGLLCKKGDAVDSTVNMHVPYDSPTIPV